MQGITHKVLPSGAHYMRIPHNADPSKDSVWLEKVRVEMLDTPDLFRRHILMDDTVISGDPVYTSYEDSWHCPEKYREKGIPIVPQSVYFGGWDCGQALTPAFSLNQVTTTPFQVHTILEVTSMGAESMKQFAPRVWDAVERRIPGHFEQVRHYADATVNTRSGTDLRSAKQEAAKHGFIGPLALRAVSNAFGPRRSAVDWLLARKIQLPPREGETESLVVPGYMIDARHCPMLRESFLGRYQWRVTKPEEGPAGMVRMEPAKNLWSHIAESLQYAGIKVRKLIEPGKGMFEVNEDEKDPIYQYFNPG
jgi:hypothetical protein